MQIFTGSLVAHLSSFNLIMQVFPPLAEENTCLIIIRQEARSLSIATSTFCLVFPHYT